MPASRCIARIAYERIPFGHSPSCHHHPPRLTTPSPPRLTGAHGYIRLEIKSAIVSPLNELSHAYAYSRSSARVCVYSRPVRLLHARTSLVRARENTFTCVRNDRRCTKHTCARARASVHPCAFVRGAACVHGHEDPGSKRSRGPSGSDPSTPARIRHTRTPMLRGRTRRCLGGVPGLYPAGLRLPPLFLLSSLLPSSSPTLFATPSSSTLLEDLPLSFPFPPSSPCSSSSYPLSSFFSSVPSPPPLLLFFFLFSAFSPLGAARIHVHPRN